MHEMAESIMNLSVNTAYACAAAVGGLCMAAMAVQGARKLTGAAKKLAAASLVGVLLIGGMVVVGTDDAGAKPSTNVVNQVEGVTNTVGQTGGGTNDWTNVEGMNTVGQTDGEGTNGTGAVSGPLTMGRFGRPNLMHGLLPSITDDDIVAGWREVSRSIDALAASVFARSDDAFVWEAAMARGARRGYWRIPFDGWDFPVGGASWTNGFVWAEGMFRPRVDSKRNGFLLLDHHLALAPAANWSRFGLDASLFWCRTNAVGGLVGTFLGAAVDDDPAKIVNAQFELFPSDGRIALRYDLARAGEGPFLVGPFENGTNHFATVSSNTAEIVFQRVHPDDWDMDGIPNSMDDDPRVAVANGGWNQSEAWAMLAFPSNAAEIAAMGYMAWATARAEDPNRRLVGLHVSSSDGAWPVLLTFGDKKVMCDCKQELGHALGLYDAYCRLEGRGDLACASAPVCRATFTDVQNEIPDMRSIILDWGEETGRGFYAVEDTVEKIVGTLLMHGYNGSGQIDIPGCSVISLDNNSVTNSSIYVPVGIDAITKNNEDVVSQ